MAEASSPARDPAGGLWLAFRDPEAFVLRWHTGGRPYHSAVFLLLAAVAILGTAAYGAAIGAPAGQARALDCAVAFAGAATLSWLAPLPAVYVLNSLSGARLRASTTFLAALVTAAWGGLGLLALLCDLALFLGLLYTCTLAGPRGVAIFLAAASGIRRAVTTVPSFAASVA